MYLTLSFRTLQDGFGDFQEVAPYSNVGASDSQPNILAASLVNLGGLSLNNANKGTTNAGPGPDDHKSKFKQHAYADGWTFRCTHGCYDAIFNDGELTRNATGSYASEFIHGTQSTATAIWYDDAGHAAAGHELSGSNGATFLSTAAAAAAATVSGEFLGGAFLN